MEVGGAEVAGGLRSLRERNSLRVVDLLRSHGTASRADIARWTGLSRSTVSSLVADLQESGLVVEQPGQQERRAAGGRPPVLLALEPTAGVALGVDFGHTHLRVAIADLSSRIMAERHQELDVDRAATEALDRAAELICEVIAEAGVDRDRVVAVGMGLPGPVDSVTGVVGSSVILPGWAGLTPADELERRVGLHVEVDNDANLGALAEVSFGAARGASDVIYLKVASGIGAGIVLGGTLQRGVIGLAGELGHVLADPEGRVCRCGNRGCLETVAAGPALLDLMRASHHGELTARDLLALAAEGDVGARRVLADAGRAIGRAIAVLVNCLNPGRVVLGGELATEPLLEGVRETLRRFALPGAVDAVRVELGSLGDRAGVLGALSLVISDTRRLSSAQLSAL
jgi:predicted NBD/HSP70 family sugar kinase/biotin operon repressor